MIDQTTLKLYSPFEREVGKYRKQIHSQRDFENYVSYANGAEDCFVSCYTTDHKTIDRCVFDTDGEGSLQDAQKLYWWAIENKFPAVPKVTGKKGYHVIILSKPFNAEKPKEVLNGVAWYIMSEALGVKRWDDKTSVDPHLVGNISAMERIPNTLRIPDLNSYCSYLPQTFVEMSEVEASSFSKSPHTFNYNLHTGRSFLELPFTDEWDFASASYSHSLCGSTRV